MFAYISIFVFAWPMRLAHNFAGAKVHKISDIRKKRGKNINEKHTRACIYQKKAVPLYPN